MRCVKLNLLILGLALCGGAALDACGPYGGYFVEPNSIKFPGVAHVGAVRGNHLLCQNDKDRVIVVDLKRRKTIDLGPTDGKRFLDGDVADGKALFLRNDRLQVVCLEACKTVHEIEVGKEPVWAFGFAGKDKAFIHRGKTFSVFCLQTGKALHTIALGDDNLRPCAAWQKVGNRVFVGGPATTICVIDVEAGKIVDRLSIEARTGIASFLVEGTQIYCLGSYFNAWAPRIDHVVCFDMEKKKSRLVDLPRELRRSVRLASGPYGTAYMMSDGRIDRFTTSGECCGTFTTPKNQPVLAIWNHRAVVAGLNEIRLLDIDETPPVARK